MTALRHRIEAVIVSLLVTSSVAFAADCQPPALRSEPARVLWTADDVIGATPLEDAILVQTEAGLRLLDASTGTERWHHAYKLDEYERTPQLVVLHDAVAMERNDQEIVFLDLETGKMSQTVDLGQWIHFLVGPPLVAITKETNAYVSSLVLVSSDGKVSPPLVVPGVTGAFVYRDVLVLKQSNSLVGHERDMLSGYRLDDLKRIWSFKSFTFNTQTIDGALLMGDIFWSQGATAIDVQTGEVLRKIPVRDPFKMGGSTEFDLQVVSSQWKGPWSPYFATCETLRRNDAVIGATIWTADLPFHVTGTLRDDDAIYIAGSRDAKHRFLVRLDWRTGEILRAWTRVPLISEMSKVDSLLFGFDLSAKLVALDVD